MCCSVSITAERHRSITCRTVRSGPPVGLGPCRLCERSRFGGWRLLSAHGRTDEGGSRKTQMWIVCVPCGAAARGVSARHRATFSRFFCVSAAIRSVFLPPAPLCSSLMDRRLEPCYLPDPLLSSPPPPPPPLSLHRTLKNTFAAAERVFHAPRSNTLKREKNAPLAAHGGRTSLQNRPRVKAALPGVSTPTRPRALTPTHRGEAEGGGGHFHA